MYKKNLLLFIFCSFVFGSMIQNIETANILCLMGVPSPSHHIWNRSIMEALAQRGHNLTILTVEIEHSNNNMHFILMENVYETIYEEFLNVDTDGIDLTTSNVFSGIKQMYDFYGFVDSTVIATDGIRELLNYPLDFKFDLIIHDFTECQVLLGFVDHFQYPPLVSISAFNMPPYTYTVSGIPIFPSFMPHIAGDFTSDMGFYRRGWNFLYHAFDWFYRKYVFMVNVNRKAKKLFGPHLPQIQEIEKRTQLTLVNIDFSIDYPQLLPPNVIPVGGLQIGRTEQMPKHIEDFLNKSNNGAIYFSLGTNMQSSYLEKNKIDIFLKVFRKLSNYNIIWKYEADNLKDVPSNLLLVDWLPQTAILAHPNLKLFITHGGLLSVQEAVWYAVPMLGIPFFVDQKQNINKVTGGGYGEKLDIQKITADNLEYNIKMIIEESRYKTNATKRSKLFRNQQIHPLDRAVFAIESVLNNDGGAEHLRLPTIDMSFIKIYMLDVLAAVIFVIGGFIMIIKRHMYLGKVPQINEPETSVEKKKK